MRVAKRGGSKAKKAELTIVGGATPRLRKARKCDWTKAKEETFLTTLAETCNVTVAAKAAGLSVSSAYARRKKVAAFRAGWAEAIATAYQRLELVMLDRALNGTEKIVVRKDGSEERLREYPNQIALHLLKMHRDSAMEAIEEPAEADIDEVRQRLFDKLQRLRKRMTAQAQGE
jgi:phage terminase small subunit